MLRNLPHRPSRAAEKWAAESNRPRTVLIALIGNIVIAVAKLGAGLLTGSAAMLAEAAHSVADCVNEILLGISLQRSRKPADAVHPYGYGRERFLWAFIAAIASFIIGGCVSVGLAIRELTVGGESGHQMVSWIVLAIALAADSVSWFQSFQQARREARTFKRSVWTHLRRTTDPVIRAVVVEDSASLIGLVLAAGGLLVSGLVGTSAPDAIASLLIGVLLAITAVGLARPLADFLIGRSLPPHLMKELQELMVNARGIDELLGLKAVYTGPEEVIVAAKIRPACETVMELAQAMDELDRRIREAIPVVSDVFVDVTAWNPDQKT